MKYLLLAIKHLIFRIIWGIAIALVTSLYLMRFLWDFKFDRKSYKEMFNYGEFCEVLKV